jgi:hypothetical protein
MPEFARFLLDASQERLPRQPDPRAEIERLTARLEVADRLIRDLTHTAGAFCGSAKPGADDRDALARGRAWVRK